MTELDQGTSFLVVDDDRVFLGTLARGLEERGFRVRAARSFDEAIRALDEEAPECAVVDLRLSDAKPMGGLELVSRLHAADEHTRIVVLTGYGSINTAVTAMRSGAVSYLQKPATIATILRAVCGESTDDAANVVPSLARLEWEHLQRVLADSGGNVSEAARRLGLHRRSLQRKLNKGAPLI